MGELETVESTASAVGIYSPRRPETGLTKRKCVADRPRLTQLKRGMAWDESLE
jgi:hypothetical protein